ncbi:MAG: FMN-binding protein [Pseudomonadales bacterium]|nr:FMN-binding protein [Pseudomonadales bacterium]MBP9035411.1 FMN-binding protein [Pseudomonadales bacterium]
MSQEPAPAPTSTAAMYRALVGIGSVCALLIVTAWLLTGPAIARNRAELLHQAISAVLPASARIQPMRLDAEGRIAPAGPGEAVAFHLGLDADGRTVGVAIEASGMGYQDLIGLIYGYAPAQGRLTGMRVLSSRETPGLGDRIIADPAFVAAFEALAVPLSADGKRVAHEVEAVAPGKRSEPWQFDAITGATISSRAVASIIAASTARWAPLLHAQADRLEGGAP